MMSYQIQSKYSKFNHCALDELAINPFPSPVIVVIAMAFPDNQSEIPLTTILIQYDEIMTSTGFIHFSCPAPVFRNDTVI